MVKKSSDFGGGKDTGAASALTGINEFLSLYVL